MSTNPRWKSPVNERKTFTDHNIMDVAVKCDGNMIEVEFIDEGGTALGVAVSEHDVKRPSVDIDHGSGRIKSIVLKAFGKNGAEVDTMRSAFRWLSRTLDAAAMGGRAAGEFVDRRDGKLDQPDDDGTPKQNYEDYLRATKSADDFHAARCQTYDTLSEAKYMLDSQFGSNNYTASDAVALAAILARRAAKLESGTPV